MVDPVALKAELDADPTARGYAPHMVSGNNNALVALLNEVQGGIAIDRTVVPTYELFEAVVPGEWSSATAQEKQRVQTILAMGEVNLKGPNTRAAFQAAFGVGTTSRTNIIALLTRPGSRSEQLFEQNVSLDDVRAARLA